MTKSFKKFLLYFTVLFSVAAHCQDQVMDSLKVVLKNPKLHDTTRLQIISDVMTSHYDDYDKNYYVLNNMLGDLALKNYKKKNGEQEQKVYTEWLAGYYSAVASEYLHKSVREPSLVYHDKAIALLRSIKSYDEMYVAYLAKAGFYVMDDKVDKAIPLIFESLKYFEKDETHYVDEMSYALQMLARIYSEQNQFHKSIAISYKAVRFFDAAYKQDPNNHILYLKSLSYGSIALCYSRMKQYQKTIDYCNKVLVITKNLRADTQTGLALSRAAEAHMKLSNFAEAERLYNEVLDMKSLSEATDDIAITASTIYLGVLHYKKGNYAKAIDFAKKGFDLSKKTGNISMQKDAADLLYKLSLNNKDYKKALEMYQFTEKLIDSSQIQSSNNALAQQTLKYNFEKKELNYKLASEKKAAVQNNVLIALSGLLLLLIFGGYFYYRTMRQKQSIAVLEKNMMKQKLLVTQMNPHFIFNSIENIRSLIYDKQNDQAVNYLTKFSKLTRQILENSNENYISLHEELEMTENYLAIQQLLYNYKFDYSIEVGDQIDAESLFLPPMLTQPFIENAIKHGLSNIMQNGKIAIRFYFDGTKFFFQVSDNGKGFSTNQKDSNHKSLAMSITKERLATYTKSIDFTVETSNITDDNQKIIGAKVIFEIPYIYEN